MDGCQIVVERVIWVRDILLGHVTSLSGYLISKVKKQTGQKSLMQWTSESFRVSDLHSSNLMNLFE